MDVNGLPMWQIAGRPAFGLAPNSAAPNIARNLDYRDEQDHLRLAQQQDVPALTEDDSFARRLAASPSPVADLLGGFAWWDASARQLKASGFAPGSIELPLPQSDPPTPVAPRDFAFGADDIVYATRHGTVVMMDVRERWLPAIVQRPGFNADLLAPAPQGGVWVFDTTNRRLGRIRGRPLRVTGLRDPAPDRFGPVEPNPNPPKLTQLARARIPTDYNVVAMAASQAGRLALLAWESGEDAAIFALEGDRLVLRFRLAGLRFPYSLTWIGEHEVAVLASDGPRPARQAFVYPMDLPPMPEVPLAPDGRVHPLIDPWEGKFCNVAGEVPVYLAASAPAEVPTAIRPLRALSGSRFARAGSVLIGPIDSRLTGCVWHRLYAEAALPDRGRIEIAALATESAAPPVLPGEADSPDWAIHYLPTGPADAPTDSAVASWCDAPSEIPFSPPALQCPRQPGSSGLFTVLLQHPDRKVRRIAGRYLWLNLSFVGDGRGSPELAALRVYAKRFSYRDHYLPSFYRETLGGSDALTAGPATPHDFMERLLCLFEGPLTETEGRIASSWLLTDPAAAPEEALPWIGRWIGVPPGPGDTPARFRQSLLAAPMTARLNGTLGGLAAALEIGTGGSVVQGGRLNREGPAPAPGKPALAHLGDAVLRALTLAMDAEGRCTLLAGGAVTRGDIVLVEGFRLRRTFATILGADLADEEDPLTLGMAESGNSFVGDSLILGDEARAELLSLYRDEIDESRRDSEGVEQFYARLAHRILVLVRGVDDPAGMRRLTDIVEDHIPAHVEPQVHQAHDALIIGAASLVGVDSYLSAVRPLEPVRLERSVVGRGDLIAGTGQLDRRADGPVSAPPTARADVPREVWVGSDFTLSAVRSAAAEGRRIARHIWTWE